MFSVERTEKLMESRLVVSIFIGRAPSITQSHIDKGGGRS